jgi:hypothetical protein
MWVDPEVQVGVRTQDLELCHCLKEAGKKTMILSIKSIDGQEVLECTKTREVTAHKISKDQFPN